LKPQRLAVILQTGAAPRSNTLPKDVDVLQKIVVDLCEHSSTKARKRTSTGGLLRELLEAQRNRKSEQLSKEQLSCLKNSGRPGNRKRPAKSQPPRRKEMRNRPKRPLEANRAAASGKESGPERIVQDLAEAEKHCDGCGKDLHLISEETSERYEYIPAQLKVIEDVRLKYACDCTVKTADKPRNRSRRSMGGASLLAQVIVSKFADHHRYIGRRRSSSVMVWRSRARLWAGGCPPWPTCSILSIRRKESAVGVQVIGTDDIGVKVLDRKLPFARTGRIWPYVGDDQHPVVIYDYTPTRGRDGPSKFLEGYQGYLQADAYSVYDAFFKPARGLIEVGCWMHARRYFIKAMDSDPQRMGPALYSSRRVYSVEDRALGLRGAERLELRQRLSAPVIEKLHQYLLEIREEVLPKSSEARAVRYALNQWEALNRFLKDGDLEIDNGATERANRGIAIGRATGRLRQRPWRQDGGRVAELHRDVQAERGRAVWLVLRCALANRYASD